MSAKGGLMMGTKKVSVLSSPQKRTINFISEKERACKEHKLTGMPQRFRIKKEGSEK